MLRSPQPSHSRPLPQPTPPPPPRHSRSAGESGSSHDTPAHGSAPPLSPRPGQPPCAPLSLPALPDAAQLFDDASAHAPPRRPCRRVLAPRVRALRRVVAVNGTKGSFSSGRSRQS
ncbi:Protein of unknown function [Gryllus bimaculatus]|nr:Protein of unknown function [Gryllus bimaculatus]